MKFIRSLAHCLVLALPFALVSSLHAAGGREKQRVIVVALDSSGSMARSDPGRRRIDAAELLLACADPDDQVGVIAFGDQPRWLGGQSVTARTQFPLRSLQSIGQADQHTDFAALLREWKRFLDAEPDGYFATHEAALVILTDGVPDAATKDNGEVALELASRAAKNSEIHVIALGPEAKSTSFTNDLAAMGHGRSAYADTDKELTEAFLKVTTVVLRLPAFQKLDRPGNTEDFGPAERSLLVFLGSGSLHPQTGSLILKNDAAKVYDITALAPGTRIGWDGTGTAFVCRREPLKFRAATELPPAALLDQPATVSLGLYNGPTDQAHAFFLQHSELQIVARPSTTGPSQILPIAFTASGRFEGSLAVSEAGDYHLTARLRAPYGDLEQSLGDYHASATAVDLPAQITLKQFPGVPGGLLSSRVRLQLLLPIGAADVSIARAPGVSVSPTRLNILPSHPEDIHLFASPSAQPGDILEIPYSVSWKSGLQTTAADAVLRIAIRRLTVFEAAKELWPWLCLAVLSLVLLIFLIKRFTPRSLQGKLQVSKDGALLYSLILPTDLRSRSLQIKSNSNGQDVTRNGALIEIPSGSDELLLTIQSRRDRGQWTSIVVPGSSRVQAAGKTLSGKKSMADIPRSQLMIPSHNLTITFR